MATTQRGATGPAIDTGDRAQREAARAMILQ